MSRLVKSNFVHCKSDLFLYSEPVPSSDAAMPERAHSAGELKGSRAREHMREVERYCADVRSQALRKADEIRKQAWEDGFQAGYASGKSKAESECAKAFDQVKKLMESLDAGRQDLFRQHEQELIDLALEIAGKVVADRIDRDDEAFIRIFRKAVEGLCAQKVVRLCVSEHAVEFATTHADYLRAMIPDAEKLEIRLIEGAAPGTLIVDTEDNNIDASTEKQLEIITQTLEDARSQRDE